MGFCMLPFEQIRLPNKSILKKIYKGSKSNWLFIGGGPGLGPQYLEKILNLNMLDSNIYSFQFPEFDLSVSDSEIFKRIEDDLLVCFEKINDLIIVGHSFGGMFLQILNLKNNKYKNNSNRCL